MTRMRWVVLILSMLTVFCVCSAVFFLMQGGERIPRRDAASIMTSRFYNEAIRLKKRPGAVGLPRIILYDLSFGQHIEEHLLLKGNGILMISIITRDLRELPVQNVRAVYGHTSYPLELLHYKAIAVQEPEAVEVFGRYRFDSYYLFPYFVAMKNGRVVLDLFNGRKGLDIVYLPVGERFEDVSVEELKREEREEFGTFPKLKDLRRFAKREFGVHIKKYLHM